MTPEDRRIYAGAAADEVWPFSRDAADRALAQDVLPLLGAAQSEV